MWGTARASTADLYGETKDAIRHPSPKASKRVGHSGLRFFSPL